MVANGPFCGGHGALGCTPNSVGTNFGAGPSLFDRGVTANHNVKLRAPALDGYAGIHLGSDQALALAIA